MKHAESQEGCRTCGGDLDGVGWALKLVELDVASGVGEDTGVPHNLHRADARLAVGSKQRAG